MSVCVSVAVVYECIRTATTIYSNTALIEAAASSISRFISGENHNYKYIGIKALTAIVAVNAKCVPYFALGVQKAKTHTFYSSFVCVYVCICVCASVRV